jgi:hypothetical protein
MDIDERDSVVRQFGVAPEQVERDHLISHVLAFLSQRFGDQIHFIGGTALARTHLPTVGSAKTSTSSRSTIARHWQPNWTTPYLGQWHESTGGSLSSPRSAARPTPSQPSSGPPAA